MPEMPPLGTGSYMEHYQPVELTRDNNGQLIVRGRSVSSEGTAVLDGPEPDSSAAVEPENLEELEDEILESPRAVKSGVPSAGFGGSTPVSEEEIVKEGPKGANKDLYETSGDVEGLVERVLQDDYEAVYDEGYEEETDDIYGEIEELTKSDPSDLEELYDAEEVEELEETEEEFLEDLYGDDTASDLEAVQDEEAEPYDPPSYVLEDGHQVVIEPATGGLKGGLDGQPLPEDMELALEYEEETALDPASIVIDPQELDENLDEDEYDTDLLENKGSKVLQEELMDDDDKKKTSYENYSVPVDNILKKYGSKKYWVIDKTTKDAGETLRRTLEEFKIEAEVTGIRKGPVITMYEILPAPGVKLSKITNLADNIALRLAASSVRIVAPIPGKHAVGIEVPNHDRSIVSFHEMINDEKITAGSFEIPVVLGKDITGESQIIELTQTPHLLIAGATGSGKSVCVNSLISTILCSKTPEEVKLLLIDPKIVELKLYNDIPHLLTPVITEPKKAFQALQYCLYEMERRYSLLDSQGVRDIKSYNRKIKMKRLATAKLPYIVVIVDEFADLMATTGKELESVLARLAAMARAVGIHLVLATQRPSIDVITGLIKANIPSRIAFMVAGKFDSRIILDAVGAEKLLGKGDMLFTSAWDPQLTRIQGAFLSEEEVGKIVAHVKTLGEPEYIDDEIFIDDEDIDSAYIGDSGNDPLMDKAIEIVTSAGKASASYLQRRLKIGYNRAARMVEDMEARGIVGPQNGSKPREILHMP
ncbi:MAG: DNA translocase FtsK [Spirochaetales bacterium]|nr:DNA translocase FtsK [Spirochaetales bacterium]